MTTLEAPVGGVPQQPGNESPQDSANLLGLFQADNVNHDANGIRKQSSLLHQSSSYLKQATSGFMRWQSRRAFWSAVDQPRAERVESGVACANTRLKLTYWFKTVGAVARRHPSVLVVPLLLGCACLAGGLAGVIVAAQKAEDDRRSDAQATARQAAGVLELLVEDRALLPAAALASLAREQPNMTALTDALPRLGPRLLQPQSTLAAVRQFLLAPFGVVSAVLTAANSTGAPAPSSSSAAPFARGASLQDNPLASPATNLALQLQAPIVATGRWSGSNGGSEVVILTQHPVYVPNVDANETWGNAEAGNTGALNCSAGCYNASSRTKLWGFALTAVSLTSLLNSKDAALSSLTENHYEYRLSVRLSGSGERLEVASSAKPPSFGTTAVTVPVQLTGSVAAGAVVAAEQLGAAQAELEVYNSDGWQPVWEGPLIAVVVVVSIGLAAMTFVMLFAYWRHMAMLKAMLPDKVLSVLNRGENYYQHFECVTVLYADVVRYTTAKTHPGEGSVPTLEVVKMLNDVHSMYESIIDKYGLIRIRRSGESFMCVGGCPVADDPVAVAVRVAACARDLVLATARFRGSGGFRVQLRVGIHTGPIVAAVVGSKLPRFSLFGDVVDVAYYMEATSRVMAVHMSDVTSQLLATANDPLLQLKPRGRMDIVGQGSRFTNWLQLEALPDPVETEPEGDRGSDRKVTGAATVRPSHPQSLPRPT